MNIGEEIKVLDHGYVKLIGTMGTDETIVEAARMSTGRGFISWDAYERCKKCSLAFVREKVDYPNDGSWTVAVHKFCGSSCDWHTLEQNACKHEDTEKFPRGDFGLCELAIEVQAPLMVFREVAPASDAELQRVFRTLRADAQPALFARAVAGPEAVQDDEAR